MDFNCDRAKQILYLIFGDWKHQTNFHWKKKKNLNVYTTFFFLSFD